VRKAADDGNGGWVRGWEVGLFEKEDHEQAVDGGEEGGDGRGGGGEG
jgi:hypothetical protein